MYSPATFATALVMTMFSAVFWGSWANTYKGTKNYAFELFYWDYIVGVVLISVGFALTLGSHGGNRRILPRKRSKPRIARISFTRWWVDLSSNIANLLLVAGIAIAGLAIAFPIAIGIAVIEGVVLSYALQPKGESGSI